MRFLLAFGAAILSATSALAQAVTGDGFAVRTLSTRADMVTGGDVLLQVTAPASAVGRIAIMVNGRAARAETKTPSPASPLILLLTGLPPGRSVVDVGVQGQPPAAQLAIVNHPITGPVISGPHQTPFACETVAIGLGPSLDADCTAATRVEYFYRSNQTPAAFKEYSPTGPPPADLAMTTTLDGSTVPYIVRREMGTINRAVYGIAFLHQPGTPLPDPWSRNGSSWNGGLIYSFGAGCQAGYRQGRTLGGGILGESQLGDYGIARGYAVASSSLNAFGTTCDDVVSAESMMMVKEYFIERFGVPRHTIGSGRSGGSMQQQLIANNYPGLLDGLIPTASFPDTLLLINHLADCELLDRAFEASALPWSRTEKAAVAGEANWDFCARNGTAFPLLRAGYCERNAVPAERIYDARTNANGIRCTYQDNLVNVFGRDSKTGAARRPFDNVGIQYGLRALNTGAISFEQFIDVNVRAGGHDVDGNVVAARTTADPEALRIAFESGRVNDASQGMAAVPIIDARPYTDGTSDVHDIVNSHITRARLAAAHGSSGNQVLHTYEAGVEIQRVQRDNLDEMEQWLTAIARDAAPARTPLDKVIRNRPASVGDACYAKDGSKITDAARCARMFPVYSNPRLVAGLPLHATTLKCALKAVDRRDYAMTLTEAQVAMVRAAFPSGVCDYTRTGVAVRAPDTWQSYQVRK